MFREFSVLLRWGRRRTSKRRLRPHDLSERGISALLIAIPSSNADGPDHLVIDDDRQTARDGKHAERRPSHLERNIIGDLIRSRVAGIARVKDALRLEPRGFDVDGNLAVHAV